VSAGSAGNDGPTGIAPVLQVHPSRRCNIACAHCYSSSGPSVREELRWELLSACLEDAAGLGYRQLAVSGGEPLLYRPLGRLLAQARELGVLTTVTTNGMLLTRARWEPLAPLVDVLAVSIDGTPAEHDEIRGRSGAFAKTVANLEVVRSTRSAFGFIFTLTQHNADSLEFVVRLGAAHGARSVQVHPLTLHGRAATTLPDARPDGTEILAALVEAVRLGGELGVVVHVDAVTIDQLVEYRGHFVPETPAESLPDVAHTLVVDADGTVVPLTHEVDRELALGSLADARLRVLASDWLAAGRGERLAEACGLTWAELTGATAPPAAVYWYDEVAARTRACSAASLAAAYSSSSRS
jgi:MoaA/NifB/PqqE/SkfB family radical SAM enzyme